MPDLTRKLDLLPSAYGSHTGVTVVDIGTHSLSSELNAAIFAADSGDGDDLWFSNDAAGTDYSGNFMDLYQWSDANSLFRAKTRLTIGSSIYLHVGDKPGDYPTTAPDDATTIFRWSDPSSLSTIVGPDLSVGAGVFSNTFDAVHGTVGVFNGVAYLVTAAAFPNLADSSPQYVKIRFKTTATGSVYLFASREAGDGGMSGYLEGSGMPVVSLDSAAAATGSTALDGGAWYSAGFAYNGGGSGSNATETFVNGSSDGTATDTAFTWVGNKPFAIGSRSDGAGELVGQVAEVCVYDEVPSDDLIALQSRMEMAGASSYWSVSEVVESGILQKTHASDPRFLREHRDPRALR